ncbi:hypothetical protein RZS08_56420, partial [Arthrospira platensis SPKY1]|nr:hypothetical protein [Arthrospira platensis SPKY1]
EEGGNPVVINNGSTEVNLWVYPEVSPVVLAPWNGFLGVKAIVETINTGSEDLGVEITLFRMDGNRSSEQAVAVNARLKPGEQRDFIVNDMEGFEEDRYGIIRIRFDQQQY